MEENVSTSPFRIDILERPWSHPDGVELRNLQQQEIAEIYNTTESEPGVAPSADDISVFLVAYLFVENQSPIAIACGALRAFTADIDSFTGQPYPGDAEIKRMFVRKNYRGKPWNAGKMIVNELERKAREKAWSRLVLEVGDCQHGAIKFYQREGYLPAPKFGAYTQAESSLFFGKAL